MKLTVLQSKIRLGMDAVERQQSVAEAEANGYVVVNWESVLATHLSVVE